MVIAVSIIAAAALIGIGLILLSAYAVDSLASWFAANRYPKQQRSWLPPQSISTRWCTVPTDWFACRCGEIREYHDDAGARERAEFYLERQMHMDVHGPVMM